MLAPLLCALLFQTVPPAQPVTLPTWTAAPPALAAKAIGQPSYGLILETDGGRFLLTNLWYDFSAEGQAIRNIRAYLILAPGGGGPYRYGFKVAPLDHEPSRKDGFVAYSKERDGEIDTSSTLSVEPNSPAEKAGFNTRYFILDIDGKTFDWNGRIANHYLSTHASVTINATLFPDLGGKGIPKAFKMEGVAVALPSLEEWAIKPGQFSEVEGALNDEPLWAALKAAKEATPECAPLSITLEDGKQVQVVRNPWGNVLDRGKPASSLFEFTESTGTHNRVVASVPTPIEGKFVKLHGRWYRILGARLGPDSRRLEAVNLEAWKPDVPALLAGRCPTQAGIEKAFDREGIEQAANQALLVWKTRTLPDQLATQNRGAAEDLVLSIEQGLLALDLDVKTMRSRLDATARAETERKAQAELAARDGKAAPPAPAAPATGSERLADVLDQRKAILMAILGSAKQSLAQQRK
jgi:hypothetical protein